jgi:hypothetical protein
MSLSTIVLNASMLYNAFIAQHVGMQNNTVQLDQRNTEVSTQGIIITDPISPTDQDITNAYTIHRWTIQTDAQIPTGTTLHCFAKTGSSYFSENSWTDWTPIEQNHTLTSPKGHYLKLKYVFTTTDRALSPSLNSVTLQAEIEYQPFATPLKIIEQHNEQLITSSYTFDYEHPGEKTIQAFIKTQKLNELIQNQKTDLERFIALNHHIAQLPNTRHNMWSEAYPWTLDQVIQQDNEQTAVKGHCMSYASVLISALTGLGYHARHWAIEGFRFMNHEVVEVWSNDLQKWIYLDPSLDQHYTDPKTGEPLSLLEMHNIFVNTFFEAGENLLMPMEQQRERIQEKGGKNAPIHCQDQGYHYGTFTTNYDWGWFHGYLAAGFLRLTTRNNFHSQPEPAFNFFGEGNDEDYGFPSWVDAKTPPKTDQVKIFSGRKRDFYWTLNQATYRAIRTSENTLTIELANTQPFFSHYHITTNGTPHTTTNHTYLLTLTKGENTFSVTPIDKYKKEGIKSQFTLIF